MRIFKRLLTKKGGVTAIEFAMLAPVFFTLFMGIIEVGLTISLDSALNTGLRAAARKGIAQPTSAAEINATLREHMGGFYNEEKMNIIVVPYAGGIRDPQIRADLLRLRTNPETFFGSSGGGIDDQRGQVVLYGVRYEWGGFTRLMAAFLPENLYAISIVKNEQ